MTALHYIRSCKSLFSGKEIAKVQIRSAKAKTRPIQLTELLEQSEVLKVHKTAGVQLSSTTQKIA